MNLEMISSELEIDLQKATARFAGNQMLYVRFLRKFAEDTTFEKLKCSVEQKNMESAEKEAHTLKGISLNLGLDRLAAEADGIVKAVRQNDYEKIGELFAACENEYGHVIECLKNLE